MFRTFQSFFIGHKLAAIREHHERIRTITNFNFSVVLFLGFLIALIPAVISERSDILQLPVYSGLMVSVILLFANKFLKSSRSIGFVFIVLGLSIALGNLFFNKEVLHLGAPLWILLVILYSFYNIGVIWSIVVSVASFSAYVIWIVYFLQDEINRIEDQLLDIIPLLVLEVSIVFFLLLAMVLVYVTAIVSKERQLTISNRQMHRKQLAIQEDEVYYSKQMRDSANNIHHYFSVLHEISEKEDPQFLKQQVAFNAIVYKVFALQKQYKDNEPGLLLTSLLSQTTSMFDRSDIQYTVDNTIDFIEQRHVFPLLMSTAMFVFRTSQCPKASNIAIHYFFEQGEVVLKYHDDCDQQMDQSNQLMEISGKLLADIGASLAEKEGDHRTHIELRFPI